MKKQKLSKQFQKNFRKSGWILFTISLISLVILAMAVNYRTTILRSRAVIPSVNYLPDQIIMDPQNPGRMVYNGKFLPNGKPKPAILCGPGDPEEFFYINNPPYTTDSNIQFLIEKGAKTVYVMAFNNDFCRVSGGCFPGNGEPLDTTLTRWDTYITQLENAGITTVFFFFDDDKFRAPVNWQETVKAIVNKLEHHPRLIWSIAEEYEESVEPLKIATEAARLVVQEDDYDHIVGLHKLPCGDTCQFEQRDTPEFTMYLQQYNRDPLEMIYNRMVSSFNYLDGHQVLNFAENIYQAEENRATVRKKNWAAIMGGASMAMVHEMGRESDPAEWNDIAKYRDCNKLMNFFEQTAVNEMRPNLDLKAEGTLYLLANPGQSYIAYARNLQGNLGISDMPAGNYRLMWMDIPLGKIIREEKTFTAQGSKSFTRPPGIGPEVSLYIIKK